MRYLRHIPFLAILLLAYNVIMLSSDVFKTNPDWIKIPLNQSDGNFYLKVSEVFAMIAAIVLYFEVLKATRTAKDALFDHMFSVGVLMVCIIEFLVVPGAGTSSFMILTLFALLDVIMGFTVGFASSRRDISFGGQ